MKGGPQRMFRAVKRLSNDGYRAFITHLSVDSEKEYKGSRWLTRLKLKKNNNKKKPAAIFPQEFLTQNALQEEACTELSASYTEQLSCTVFLSQSLQKLF